MEEKFMDFYNNYFERLKKYYDTYNTRKAKKLQKVLLFTVLIAVLCFVSLYIFFQNIEYCIIATVFCTLVAFIGFYIAFLMYLKKDRINIVDNIIYDAVEHISGDENSKFNPSQMVTEEVIDKMELFDLNKLEYSGKNVIQANYNKNPMTFCDVDIYYYNTVEREETYYDKEGNKHTRIIKEKVKKFIFTGCYISAKMNKKIKEHIYLIPNNISDLLLNGKIKDYITYDGDEVKLENIEFSDKYKVFSDDEIQARYILSISLMEKIMKLDNIFDNKKFIVFKEDGRFAICMSGYTIKSIRESKIPDNIKSKKMRECVHKVYEKIYNLFSIYDILDLGNDLFE